MATEKRLIDSKGKFTLNAGDITGHIMCVENGYATVFDRFAKVVCKFSLLDAPTVDAVPVDEFKLHHVIIDNEGVPEVKLQIGDRYFILRTDPVDVREVVQCKDCKYRIHDDVTKEWFCNSWHSGFVYVKPNDFCSYGERKCPDE